MTLLSTITELKIDLSSIGIMFRDKAEPYYCTPENAEIIGWAGVDGIHYCTIPRFGQMVFAVNPMNFGDCVHPIAFSFRDLLCLLLSCGDMSALEQCHAWDRKQYNAFLKEYPITEEQQAVLDKLKTELKLKPIKSKLYMYAALSPVALASFAGENTTHFGKAFLRSYIGVCMEGAVIVLACIIFSAFASSGVTVVDPDASVVTQVWSYLGEVIFNMLVLVGLVKAADRIAKEMFGL